METNLEDQTVESEISPISLQGTFCFACHSEVPCFNECCRDLNQFLTPYDILRLKNYLELSSAKFLEQYTSQHIGPGSGLPVITLKPRNRQDLACPFVTPKGCSVYEDRPSSCRTYPLMRGVSRDRQTGRRVEQFAVLKEPHCCGFDKGSNKTVRQWIDEQGLAAYNQINDKLLRIIGLKNIQKPGALDITSRHMFFTALYDLDHFRSQIVKKHLLTDLQVDSSLVDKALEDDVALLEVGMLWIQRVLFGR